MERVKLGDVCEILNGYAFESEKYVDSGIRVIRITNVQKGFIEDKEPQFYPLETRCEIEKYMLKSGDLLISLTGNVGRVALLEDRFLPAALNQRVACLRLKSDTIIKSFVYHLLNSDKFENDCIMSAKGVAQKNMSTEWLKSFEIPILPLKEQKRISSILDKLTALIDKRKQQLEKLDELVKSRFIEMFGDPIDNPYNWRQTTLKEVGIGKLSYGSGASACEYDGKVRYIRITDIDNDGKLNDTVLSPNVIDEKYLLNEGDILFARSGATVGKSYRYRLSDGKCLYAGYLIRLVPNTRLVLPDYVFYYTKTGYYERFIESSMKVVAQPNINAQQYGDLIICVPPMELQNRFIHFVAQVEKSKAEIQKGLKKLELLKNALMQKYFG